MFTRWVILPLVVVAFFLGQRAVAGPGPEKPSKKDAAQAAAQTDPKPANPAAPASARGPEKSAKMPSPPRAEVDDPFAGGSCEKPAKKAKPPRTVNASAMQSSVPPTEAIRRALDKRIEIQFVETPIRDVMEFLRQCLQVPIVLQVKALNDVGLSADTPITCTFRGISARSALNLMLSELDLTWTVSNEVLLITTPEEAESMLETVVYEVHDLVAAQDEKGVPVNDFDQLIDVITNTILPTAWDTVGGPGSIAPFEGNGITVLVVSQTRQVHEQVEKLLADLRKASHTKPGEPICIRTILSPAARGYVGSVGKSQPAENKPAAKQPAAETGPKAINPAVPAGAGDVGKGPAKNSASRPAANDDPVGPPNPSPVKGHNKSLKKAKLTERVEASTQQAIAPPTKAILRALDKQVEMEFVETPIDDVIDCLGKSLQVPIVLQVRALKGVGIAPDTSITFRVRGISARSALNLMLEQLDLTWTIANEVLLITTPEKADATLETVVYDVYDLVAVGDEKDATANDYDFDSLIDLITCSVSPTKWDSSGPGPIPPFPCGGVTAIVVLQTRQVHEQIEKLLADLRKASRTQPGEPITVRTMRPARYSGRPTRPAHGMGGGMESPDKESPKPAEKGMGMF